LNCARSRFDVPGTPGAARPQISRAGERAIIIVYATLGVPIREADSCATTRPESADHDDTTPWSISRPWRANLAASAIERIRCRLRRAGRDGWEPFPKAAIYCHFVAETPLRPFQPLHSLPPRGHAGRPVIGHCLSVIGHWFLGIHSSGCSDRRQISARLNSLRGGLLFAVKVRSPQDLANARERAKRHLVQAVRCDLRHGQRGAHFRPDS
jgi:hypothetical protein